MNDSQTAKDVRADRDSLFEIFERLEAFFERLEIYTEAALDQKMVETVTKIMAEVLNIIGIATKEMKQGRTSKFSVRKSSPLTESFSERYLKKLFGNGTDIEDALKRLDVLTQQEARMAAAQVLKATHTVDDSGRVRGVADIALSVDNRVAGIDERVAGIDDRVASVDDRVVGVEERVAGVDEHVAGVGDRVKDVDDRVKAVDDKLVAVVDGARYFFNQSSKNCSTPNARRWERGQGNYSTSS